MFKVRVFAVIALVLLLIAACTPPQPVVEGGSEHHDEAGHDDHHDEEGHAHDGEMVFEAVELADGEKLQVVATMNIVGDIVAQVGGDLVDLTVMMPIGADAHSYTPTPQDVAAVSEAHIVFSHGLGMEEGISMDELLDNAGGQAVTMAVAQGIETREFAKSDEEDELHDEEGEHHDEDGEHHDEEGDHHDEEGEHHDEEGDHHHDEDGEHHHHHHGVDPHAWTSPVNVLVFVHNIEHALSGLDPANAEAYQANAAAYEAELEELDTWVESMIAEIPAENRKMVTDHRAFGYYTDRYGLEMVGAVIPSYSTLAEPSAQELAELQEAISTYDVGAIFVGSTVNPTISEQVAADTDIKLIPIYTGSLGEAGSGAETYLDYIRYNTNAIVDGLSGE